MPRRSSANHAALQVLAAAEAPDDGVVAHLDAGEAQRRVAVGVAVGEGRVVDHLDARRAALDEEQRRQLAAVDERLGHDDVDLRDVAVGDEPLLAVDAPAVLDARGGRRDPRRVGAGVLLGDGVGVVQLAAQRGLEVAVDLRLGAVGQDVVGARACATTARWWSARAAPRPGTTRVWLQPWPPCSTACRPPPRRRSIAAWRISAIRSAGRRPRARSASTSSGISTSSTKARARACSSACSGVRVDAAAAISVVMDPWG